MKLLRRGTLQITLWTLVSLSGWAIAQQQLTGTYLEPTVGFVVEFAIAPTGEFTGTLYGSGAPLPLTLQADQQTASGWFMLANQVTGFSAQLQPDGSTLLVWLYSLDNNGQPVPGTEEQYTATRQQVDLSNVGQPPAVNAPPIVGPPPVIPQPPVNQEPPMIPEPPVNGQPPVIPEPPVNQQPPAIPQRPVGPQSPAVPQPPVSPPATPVSPAMPVTDGQQVVGRWQTSVPLQGAELIVFVDFAADGTYREEGYVDGVEAAWYSGNWSLTPEGLLEQATTAYSPEFCVSGQCSPNSSNGPSYSQVQLSGPDTLILTPLQEDGQPETQIVLQRVTTEQQPVVPGGNNQ